MTTAVTVTISGKGVLAKSKFTVVTGAVGNGKCGTDTKNQRGCFIVIGNGKGTPSAAADISFAE